MNTVSSIIGMPRNLNDSHMASYYVETINRRTDALSVAIGDRKFRSITFWSREAELPSKIESVIVVGESGTGKTTLVNTLRGVLRSDVVLSDQITIPKRIVTRPQRRNDDVVENMFVTPRQFEDLIAQGAVSMHWERELEGTKTYLGLIPKDEVGPYKRPRLERYGFLKPEDGKMPVYSANSAILWNTSSVRPLGILNTSLIVAAYALDETRLKRIQRRSPDLTMAEMQKRLGTRSYLSMVHSHLAIITEEGYEQDSKKEVVELIRMIVENR